MEKIFSHGNNSHKILLFGVRLYVDEIVYVMFNILVCFHNFLALKISYVLIFVSFFYRM